jgi:hypothetical protein
LFGQTPNKLGYIVRTAGPKPKQLLKHTRKKMDEIKNKEKRVVFTETDVRHAQLRIRLQHDNLSQADFFRALITGYLENDGRIVKYLANYKEKHGIQNKKKRGRVVEEIEQGEHLLEKFGIKDDELESIFDLIAQEFPDL